MTNGWLHVVWITLWYTPRYSESLLTYALYIDLATVQYLYKRTIAMESLWLSSSINMNVYNKLIYHLRCSRWSPLPPNVGSVGLYVHSVACERVDVQSSNFLGTFTMVSRSMTCIYFRVSGAKVTGTLYSKTFPVHILWCNGHAVHKL